MPMRWREQAKSIYKEWRSNVIIWLFNTLGGGTLIVAAWHVAQREFHRSPVDWYFVGVLIVVGIVLVIAGLWRGSRLNPTIQSLQEELKTVKDRLMEPQLSVNGVPIAASAPLFAAESKGPLFSPLQIEAFQIAKEMRTFAADFEPKKPDGITSEMTEKEKMARTNERINWALRCKAAYQLRFEDRHRKLLLRFTEKGIRPYFPKSAGVPSIEKEIAQDAIVLTVMAHRIDGVELQEKSQ
jgi:hypothetical protein